MDWLNRFPSVWLIDFEFSQPPGERPSVVCLVAREFHSKRLVRIGMDELRELDRPPFDVGRDALLVAYFSSAEWNCFLALGWQLPECVLDLWCEFRCALNGTRPKAGWGLLSCLVHHGLDSMLASEKTEMRELAMKGGPYRPREVYESGGDDGIGGRPHRCGNVGDVSSPVGTNQSQVDRGD